MNKKTILLFGFILLKFSIHYNLISAEYDLHRDEYLHLDQAHHLAWGFQSVPPVTSWISYLILLLGNGVFWVKFFPALFGALTIVVVWKTIEEMNGGLFALILGATAILFSSLLRINILYQPNSLDILMWTCFYFAFIKYLLTENNKWLYILAVTTAFGFLNKYNILFLLLGLFPALLLTSQRKMLTQKHLYGAIALCLLLISPNLIWQYNNHFPVVHHVHELTTRQLEKVSRFNFLKEQVLFFIGSIYVLIASLISLYIHEPFKKFRVLAWAFLFTLSIYLFFKAKAYYAIGLYPIFMAFGAVYIEYVLRKGWKKYLQPICILLPLIMFYFISKVAFPNIGPGEIQQHLKRYQKLGMLSWEDGKEHTMPQDFADMLGWKELAMKVDSALTTLGNTKNTLVFCDNYGEAGAVNFYSKNKTIQAVSFNADYINWINLTHKITNVILIKETTDEDPGRLKEKQLFESVTAFDEITNPFAREKGTTIFILKNAKADINRIIQKGIDARNKNTDTEIENR